MTITPPLREYLGQRRADIQAQIKSLRAELAEVDAAAAAVFGNEAEPRQRRERGSAGTGRKTLKEMAVEALQKNTDGLEAAAILQWIKERYGLDVARESMSPQLSRLGQEGEIVRNGYVWRLKMYEELDPQAPAQKDETPGVSPPDASEDEDLSDLV
jgi:hypothetical protein